MNFEISPRKTAFFFFYITVILVMIHTVLFTFEYAIGGKIARFFLKFMDLNREKSVPTLFSVFLILLCAVILSIICLQKIKKKEGQGFYWGGLSIILLFLAIDEGTAFHESVGEMVGSLLQSNTLPFKQEGYLYFPWIIPYFILCLAIGLIFVPFLMKLPKRTRNLFLLSGLVYVTGTMVIEVFSAREAYLFGQNSIVLGVLHIIEEFLEMSGMVLFLFALLDHMSREIGPVSFSLKRQQ